METLARDSFRPGLRNGHHDVVHEAAKPRRVIGAAGRTGTLEQRLIALVAPSRHRLRNRLLTLAVAVAVVDLVFGVPHPVPQLPAERVANHNH